MNRISRAFAVKIGVAGLLCAYVGIATAQSQPSNEATMRASLTVVTQNDTQAAQPVWDASAIAAARVAQSIKPPRKAHPSCLRTGSRIAVKSSEDTEGLDECLPIFGRSYTRQDIQRTGSNNLADAMRTLDPSVY